MKCHPYRCEAPKCALVAGLHLALLMGAFVLADGRHAAAASVTVGAGSYNTTLPSGRKGPSDETGAPVTPKKTASIPAGPFPTHEWWSSMAWKYRNTTGANFSQYIYVDPLSAVCTNEGLNLWYSTLAELDPGQPLECHWRKYSDLCASVTTGFSVMNSPDTRVDAYSDWSVTGEWNDGTRVLKATLVQGCPFAFFTVSGGSARVVAQTSPFSEWYNSNGTLGITVNGHHYGVFGPTGASWTLNYGNTYISDLGGNDYFSIAVLPDNAPTTLAFYRLHAYAFVTSTQVDMSYSPATATVTSAYTVTTQVREGAEARTLQGLYPHQWKNTAASLTPHAYAGHQRGTIKVLEGNSFSTSMPFNGILPWMPDMGTYNRSTLAGHVADFMATTPLIPVSDTYWTGKALARAAMVVPIAEQLGNTTARDTLLAGMKSVLQDWFQAPDGKTTNMFHLDSSWGTLIGYPAGYGSDTELNDHHFHYGYFVMAAAVVAHYDPAWAADSQWGGMVKMLIREVASANRADPLFCHLRTYSPYAGHSWANGHAGFGAGNNQESSSEAVNFAAALILWGSATGDNALRDLGVCLYTNETHAIAQYWLDVDQQVLPAVWNHPVYSIVWGDGGNYLTYFGNKPEYVHGINFLPITGGSFYLGRNRPYIQRNYLGMLAAIGQPQETDWQDIIWSFQALDNPTTACAKFDATPGYTPQTGGETKAHTYHWIRNLDGMGAPDFTVTADHPIAVAFTKNDPTSGTVRTYVAHNPGASPLTVNFSTGHALTVPARSMGQAQTSSAGVEAWKRYD